MYIERRVTVEEILYEDEEIQILKTSAEAKRALLYLTITPRAKVTDEVIVNVTSTELRLGTGGLDIVTAIIGACPKEENHPNGHIIKARYLPSQLSVLAVEAQESNYHHLFKEPFTLRGKKVLIGELHSMIPICFWGMDYLKKDGKMVVIISDEASIPLSFSQHVRTLKKDERFVTITIGQAYGGTYEAVNLQTALQFATEVLNGDLIFVTLGPGVVGTGTIHGFSGIELASWANIIGSLNGIPVWVPRLSEKDKRERHRGISHHTMTPLTNFTYVKSILPLPTIKGVTKEKITRQVEDISQLHEVHWMQNGPLEELLQHCLTKSPLPIKTMGRQYVDDPVFFLGVAAAVKWILSYTD
ncbi:DUF3866 family protein [Anaerobacillus isosaccharinicus]|uniref:DUF3866 family protein n=1 Tax=Anaerobacillus isosaccharinicus TaxID=1532552 RepID=A0A1S2L920_9BACI|nr:DUF3866 family protein [Anaerobacillus isosaccharinicus]MBA5585728.1 DUF3866 family protein [Anaerobacillus isosaccharinicus]QOY35966.1 DUF3866 family protein [Anaerobacillus isosaccharinicus]